MTRHSSRKRGGESYSLQSSLYTASLGSDDDDPYVVQKNNNGARPVPVLRPTIEEFSDFYGYVSSLDRLPCSKLGLVKVIPPKEWSWKMSPNAFTCKMIVEGARIIKPIKQYVGGKKGAYRLDLLGSKHRRVDDFRKEALKHDIRLPKLARDPMLMPLTITQKGKEVPIPMLKGQLVEKEGNLTWIGEWAATAAALKDVAHPELQHSFSYAMDVGWDEVQQCHRLDFEGSFSTPDESHIADKFVLFCIPFLVVPEKQDEVKAACNPGGQEKDKGKDEEEVKPKPPVRRKQPKRAHPPPARQQAKRRVPTQGKSKKLAPKKQNPNNAAAITATAAATTAAFDFAINTSSVKLDCCHVEGYGESRLGKYHTSGELGVSGVLWANRVYLEGFGNNEEGETTSLDDSNSTNISITDNQRHRSKEFDLSTARYELEVRDFGLVENSFWASMNATTIPPIYGGDQSGTLFGERSWDSWNLNSLDSILSVGFGDKQARGISTSMLYYGMWRAMFAWHTEDMELNSINFVHFGAPKVWYAIPPEHSGRFETLVRAEFGAESNQCTEFMRHKNIMVSPALLRRDQVPFVQAVQHPGEFMITFPRSYHGGFNAGFNVAEAVNFATPNWIDHGRRARWCRCEKWTFRLNMDEFIDKVRMRRPGLLPEVPAIGDVVWLYYRDEGDIHIHGKEEEEEEEEGTERWWLCRLRKGRNKVPFMAVPLDKDSCPYSDFYFNPQEEKWQWPFEREIEMARKRAARLKCKQRSCDEDDEEGEQDEEMDAVAKQHHLQVRAMRFVQLQISRKSRLVARHAHMFHLMQREPSVLLKMIEQTSLLRQEPVRVRSIKTHARDLPLEEHRLHKLAYLAKSRKRRREVRKENVRTVNLRMQAAP